MVRYEVGDPAVRRLLDSARQFFESQLVLVRPALDDVAREAFIEKSV